MVSDLTKCASVQEQQIQHYKITISTITEFMNHISHRTTWFRVQNEDPTEVRQLNIRHSSLQKSKNIAQSAPVRLTPHHRLNCTLLQRNTNRKYNNDTMQRFIHTFFI